MLLDVLFLPPEQEDANRLTNSEEDVFIFVRSMGLLGMMEVLRRPLLWLWLEGLSSSSVVAERVFSLPGERFELFGSLLLFLRRIILMEEGCMGDVMTIVYFVHYFEHFVHIR